jgi:histidinol-phosphate aminotransferase
MKTVEFNIEELVRENIRQLKPYSSARDEYSGEALIFLDANENPYDTGYNRYPDPYQSKLKTRLAELKEVPSNQIFMGNGSDEAIDLLFRAFCEPGQDNVITLPPTYGMYNVSAGINNVEVKEVCLLENFQPDVLGVMEASNDNSKLLFICTPNNPTGNSINKTTIEQLCSTFDGLVVVDEAYIDFSQERSCIELLNRFPNLVVLQTFSKAWGMAGIRLGALYASAEIIEVLNKIKPPYNVSQPTQEIALELLENIKRQKQWVADILKQRNQLINALDKLPFVEMIYPSEANFLLIKSFDLMKTYNYLVKSKIIIRNRANIVLCDDCLRVTIGTEKENQQLIEVLTKFQNN